MLANLKNQLKDHLAKKPLRPRRVTFLLRDATKEAITWRLNIECPSVGLMSDEGGQILNGRAADNLTLLNNLHSGGELIVDRRDSESYSVKGARLTLSIMVQEKTFKKFLATRGELARDNGLLARCLMAYPPSTQGTREDWSIEEAQWPHLETFQKRLTELLEMTQTAVCETGSQRTLLEFSPDAKILWVSFANHIERNLNPGGMYSDVRDAASKTAEHTARMAALFHFFEGRAGDIQRDSVEQACQICEWYLGEFKRIFYTTPAIPQAELDATALDSWIRNVFTVRGEYIIKRNIVRQFGPNQLRNKSRLESAISILVYAGRIRMIQDLNTRAWYLELFVQSPPYVVF